MPNSPLTTLPDTLPKTMRHIALPQTGGPECMQMAQAPLPVPGPGELLIKVEAAGVNRPDVAQRQGAYPPPPGASPILGLEVAGTIVALNGDTEGFRLGDKVTALANGGGYAEYCVVPASQSLPWPAGYDAIRAGALPETYFTVWANLFDMADLKAGEHVLIHGGSSGIGTTAIQLAHAMGAKVSVTVGNAAKADACRALGADRAINYHTEDFAEIIAADGGVDVVLDMIGASYFQKNLACLKRDGRLSIIALLGGAVAESVNLGLIMTKRLHVMGSTMRPRSRDEKRAIRDHLQEKVWPKLSSGTLAPVIHAVFGFDQVMEAHTMMEGSQHIGKIMLTWD